MIYDDAAQRQRIDFSKLAYWAQSLSGNISNISEFSKIKEQPSQIAYYQPQVVTAYDNYLIERDALFPGMDKTSQAYWTLPKQLRKEYLKYYPQLDAYLKWNAEMKKRPKLEQYFKDRKSYYDEKLAVDSFGDMPESVLADFNRWAVTGKEMRAATRMFCYQLWEKYANPEFDTFEEYMKKLKAYQ